MSAKEHYEKHLANYYSWMVGNLDLKSGQFKQFLLKYRITPTFSKVALDLGAGIGMQSIALKSLGFEVTAIDFSQKLLDELKSNPKAAGIKTARSDIRDILKFKGLRPELMVCAGDTITHLEHWQELKRLISDSREILVENGVLVFTYRDYSVAPKNNSRIVPVKSSDERILTCILEYREEKVKVTDVLYERSHGKWMQKVSSYEKLRINPELFAKLLIAENFDLIVDRSLNGMQTLIAKKQVR